MLQLLRLAICPAVQQPFSLSWFLIESALCVPDAIPALENSKTQQSARAGEEPVRVLAERHGTMKQAAWKWRKRGSVA